MVTTGHTPSIAQLCKGADSNELYVRVLEMGIAIDHIKDQGGKLALDEGGTSRLVGRESEGRASLAKLHESL